MRTYPGRFRLIAFTILAVVVVALMPLASTPPAFAGPIADSDATYEMCGRTFPDPQAYWAPEAGEDTPHPGAGTSPYAKGNAPCAAKTFISYEEAIRGLRYLENRNDTGQFIKVINLATTKSPKIREVLKESQGDGQTEGLASNTGGPDKGPLYLVRVTAPRDTVLAKGVRPVPLSERKHYAWSLSVHGIERAGVEGGLRAIEDLATWGAHEPDRPILETYDSDTIETVGGAKARNMSAGEILMNSVSYFMLPNPDGWRRGDLDRAGASFARFNGNGMDLNRDWPEIGYVDPDFTPWSESESRTYGRVLQNLSDEWAGGIDLHGMVQAKAFSFTLIGGSQRPYDKNERTMQFVEQAWDDASKRLTWSSLIKPNSEVDQCLPGDGVGPNGEVNPPPCDQRMYGVQYGTIWDTIDYTATGAIGNWIDSPIGLDADGIDNEMSLSHLGNCGVGNCYIPEAEQLHVDGNKSLIYAMLNFSVQPPESKFDVDGNVGYFANPRRLVDRGARAPEAPKDLIAPRKAGGVANHAAGATTVLHEFTVNNKAGKTYTGGISGEVRWTNVGGHSTGALNKLRVQYQDPKTKEWSERPAYAPGPVYVIAGQRSDWNYPEDGAYRLVVTGPAPVQATWELAFTRQPAWPDPVQDPYNVSNMDFFSDLKQHMAPGSSLTRINVDKVLGGDRNLSDFDTVVIADDALLPGFRQKGEPTTQGVKDLPKTDYTVKDRDAIAAALRTFTERGGNLVLTDDGFRALAWMGIVPSDAVHQGMEYAAAVAFTTDGGDTQTYDDPLNKGVNPPGSAENTNNRRQVAEPLPTGYAIDSGDDHPQWFVDTEAWTAAGGRVAGTQGDSGPSVNQTTLGELKLGKGRVRILGSLLPYPTSGYYHPFGLSSYAVTDVGYTLAKNMWTWSSPGQTRSPNLSDDRIEWIKSGTPTRIAVDGSKF